MKKLLEETTNIKKIKILKSGRNRDFAIMVMVRQNCKKLNSMQKRSICKSHSMKQ